MANEFTKTTYQFVTPNIFLKYFWMVMALEQSCIPPCQQQMQSDIIYNRDPVYTIHTLLCFVMEREQPISSIYIRIT